MSRVIAVVEGQTEQDFVRDVLAPYLSVKGVFLSARLVGKPGHKGGVGAYERARRDMLVLLKQDLEIVVTTMFDFYAMPKSWPKRLQAKSVKTSSKKATLVEKAIKADILEELGSSFDEKRFISYVQMHEFESLLFCNPVVICKVLRNSGQESKIQAIRDAFSSPEEINDSEMTAPSKRLLNLFSDYRKRVHGLIAAKRIGIDRMRSECPHFAQWLEKLELFGCHS
jgi:hypothetical protein